MSREYKDFYWLNEDSQKFLQGGYLLENVTVEERVRQIANHAESILGIEGYADELYDVIAKGWMSLSTPIWCNFGAGRSLPISCVVGDTWINTDKGGKQAKDIQIGDMVLTHKNRYRPVTAIMPTPKKDDIWRLKVGTRMTNLYITGNHLVLTNLGWVRVDELNPRIHLIAVNGDQVDYVGEEHVIDMKEFVNFPFIVEEGLLKPDLTKIKANLVSSTAHPREYVEVDEDLAWALGLWFAEGSLSIDSKKDPNGIRLTLNTRDRLIGERWFKIISSKFNLNGSSYDSVVQRNEKENRWISINVNSKAIGNLFSSFGRGCKVKTMPDWMLNLPKRHLLQIWNGMMIGDGTKLRNTDLRRITLANPKLLLQLYTIGLRTCRSMSLQMQEKASSLSSTKYVYSLYERERLNSEKRQFGVSGIMFNDGLVYCPIQTLERTNKVEDVYDFTVEEDHSFSCAGVVVHNCFNSYMPDSIDGIFSTIHEVAMMSKEGGGTSIYMGDIRPRGAKITNNGASNGSFSFLEPIQSTLNSVSQGKSRRGMVATYIDIEHGDIEEWLNIRKEGSPIQDIYWGVCVGNDWLDEMRKGDRYKREIWAKVLQTRSETGVPYIFFKDNANNNKPDVYRDRNLKINASNLCVEIMLPSTKDESFVCCLSSVNLLHFDKWKDSRLVKIATYFLDAVMSEFIHLAKHIPGFERAVRFAERHRALGLGVLGWHSYLQSNMIPFESYKAMQKNAEVFRTIRAQADEASRELAERYGEPELLKGYGRRNTTLLAIAPTKSSSFILGQVSPSIEPFNSNFFIKDLAKIKTVFKNPFLEELLEKKGFNTEEIWNDILVKEGSVQHLDILTQEEKDVFKTFSELSQITVIQQAAQRQVFVDQGQSVNLMVHPATPPQDINGLYMLAADLGLKGLYYQFSSNAAQVFNRSLVTDCLSCSA